MAATVRGSQRMSRAEAQRLQEENPGVRVYDYVDDDTAHNEDRKPLHEVYSIVIQVQERTKEFKTQLPFISDNLVDDSLFWTIWNACSAANVVAQWSREEQEALDLTNNDTLQDIVTDKTLAAHITQVVENFDMKSDKDNLVLQILKRIREEFLDFCRNREQNSNREFKRSRVARKEMQLEKQIDELEKQIADEQSRDIDTKALLETLERCKKEFKQCSYTISKLDEYLKHVDLRDAFATSDSSDYMLMNDTLRHVYLNHTAPAIIDCWNVKILRALNNMFRDHLCTKYPDIRGILKHFKNVFRISSDISKPDHTISLVNELFQLARRKEANPENTKELDEQASSIIANATIRRKNKNKKQTITDARTQKTVDRSDKCKWLLQFHKDAIIQEESVVCVWDTEQDVVKPSVSRGIEETVPLGTLDEESKPRITSSMRRAWRKTGKNASALDIDEDIIRMHENQPSMPTGLSKKKQKEWRRRQRKQMQKIAEQKYKMDLAMLENARNTK